MKRIIATLLAMLMLFAALASAESLEDYITESGLPIVTDASKLEEMDILWVASPLVPAGATGNRVDQAE